MSPAGTARAAAIPLAAALCVLAAGCGGGKDAPGTTVGMTDLRFEPERLSVKAGRTVTWRNDEDVLHNVTATRGAQFKSKAFGRGKTFRFRPTRPGTIAYVCTLHPGMKGSLAVTR